VNLVGFIISKENYKVKLSNMFVTLEKTLMKP